MQVICPLCRQPLNTNDKSWQCTNNHNFDIAKQGHCNLLPVQHKKSLQPGDSADMVSARNRFLSGGHYQAVNELINQTIIHFITDQQLQKTAIIDAGCGEGYYSSSLAEALSNQTINWQMVGIDISKYAVLAAAKRSKTINWFVANSSHIPIEDHSADIVLSLFSPLPCEEFYRCLKPGGLLIFASTGSNHLIELRKLVYETVIEQSFEPSTVLDEHFSSHQKQRLQQSLFLTENSVIKDLFAMTPHYWRVSPDKKNVLNDLKDMTVSIDIQLHSFTAKSS
jgi:23S rRNA (guanine745-N1)-methyltransferase